MSANGRIFARIVDFAMNAQLKLEFGLIWTVQSGIGSGSCNAEVFPTPYAEQRNAIIRQQVAAAVVNDPRLSDVTGQDVLLMNIIGTDQVANDLGIYKEEKTQGGKLQYTKYYLVKNGDGTYSNLALEYLYTWQGSKLMSMTTNIYDDNDILVETVIDNYATTANGATRTEREIE